MANPIRAIEMLGLLAVAVLCAPACVMAEPPAQAIRITLHPQEESQPAFRYRLLPGYLQRTPGNAAVFYGKVKAEENVFFGDSELHEVYHGWIEAPLDELRNGQAGMAMVDGHILDDLRRAANCDYCDWQLPIRTESPFYTLMLPEVQESREFARILAAKARIHIANREFEEAINTLQIGYAGGLNVAQSRTFVSALVGIAWSELMNSQVETLVQQRGAPNLYWALTTLPTPLFNVRDAIDVEAGGVELSIPGFADLDSAARTDEQWQEFYLDACTRLLEWISSRESDPVPTREALADRCRQQDTVTRRRLVEYGLEQERVDEMTVFEAASHRTLWDYRRLHQDVLKYLFVPYPQAVRGFDRTVASAGRPEAELAPIAKNLVIGVVWVKRALTRADREIAVLRVFEALRIHAARNGGALPESLDEVTAVPIPSDPVTGSPFEYRLEQGRAVLTGPPLPNSPLNYEIVMAED